jgi:hypothetical protein
LRMSRRWRCGQRVSVAQPAVAAKYVVERFLRLVSLSFMTHSDEPSRLPGIAAAQ